MQVSELNSCLLTDIAALPLYLWTEVLQRSLSFLLASIVLTFMAINKSFSECAVMSSERCIAQWMNNIRRLCLFFWRLAFTYTSARTWATSSSRCQECKYHSTLKALAAATAARWCLNQLHNPHGDSLRLKWWRACDSRLCTESTPRNNSSAEAFTSLLC